MKRHFSCGCQRSAAFTLFCLHDDAYGAYPVPYSVARFWIDSLEAEKNIVAVWSPDARGQPQLFKTACINKEMLGARYL